MRRCATVGEDGAPSKRLNRTASDAGTSFHGSSRDGIAARRNVFEDVDQRRSRRWPCLDRGFHEAFPRDVIVQLAHRKGRHPIGAVVRIAGMLGRDARARSAIG
jgi:hypothetical protein